MFLFASSSSLLKIHASTGKYIYENFTSLMTAVPAACLRETRKKNNFIIENTDSLLQMIYDSAGNNFSLRAEKPSARFTLVYAYIVR